MASKRGAWCAVEYCQEPKDKERNAGLCAGHSTEWLRSDEFRESTRDENVRAAMSLGLRDMAMRMVAKYRRRWVKRMEAVND